MEVIINNSSYNVQRVFAGQREVSDLIKSRIWADISQILPLTDRNTIPYNNPVDCSIVRRHNGK